MPLVLKPVTLQFILPEVWFWPRMLKTTVSLSLLPTPPPLIFLSRC